MSRLKKCSKCKKDLPATTEYFHRDKQNYDGLCNHCKECRKEYYKKNKDKIIKKANNYGKEYYKNNKDKIKLQQKEYYRKNKEKELKRRKDYYRENRDVILEKQRKYKGHKKRKEIYKIVNGVTTKRCSKCGKWKPMTIDYFYRNKRNHNGYANWCKDCRRDNARKRYNMDNKIYNILLEKQEYKCSICGRKETSKSKNGKQKPLSIDHDHNTGEVRGLLCTKCNFMIGSAEDNPFILIKAVHYLNRRQKRKFK